MTKGITKFSVELKPDVKELFLPVCLSIGIHPDELDNAYRFLEQEKRTGPRPARLLTLEETEWNGIFLVVDGIGQLVDRFGARCAKRSFREAFFRLALDAWEHPPAARFYPFQRLEQAIPVIKAGFAAWGAECVRQEDSSSASAGASMADVQGFAAVATAVNTATTNQLLSQLVEGQERIVSGVKEVAGNSAGATTAPPTDSTTIIIDEAKKSAVAAWYKTTPKKPFEREKSRFAAFRNWLGTPKGFPYRKAGDLVTFDEFRKLMDAFRKTPPK